MPVFPEGYRRFDFMMLDQDIVAQTGLRLSCVVVGGPFDSGGQEAEQKGFRICAFLCVRNEHWHIDISYLNLGGTF